MVVSTPNPRIGVGVSVAQATPSIPMDYKLVEHALFHFPLPDADGVPQALRLVSGAGVPGYHDDGPGLWAVTWPGEPHRLTEHESWIAVWADRHVYGWVRFCCTENESSHIADPARARDGDLLFVDRYVRFSQPIAFHWDSKRSRHLTPTEAAQLSVPNANGGEPIAWVDAGRTLRRGCEPL